MNFRTDGNCSELGIGRHQSGSYVLTMDSLAENNTCLLYPVEMHCLFSRIMRSSEVRGNRPRGVTRRNSSMLGVSLSFRECNRPLTNLTKALSDIQSRFLEEPCGLLEDDRLGCQLESFLAEGSGRLPAHPRRSR